MNANILKLAGGVLLSLYWQVQATPNNPNTDWLKDAKDGVLAPAPMEQVQAVRAALTTSSADRWRMETG
jgi:hypothetical protein